MDELAGLVLRAAMLLIVSLCVKFGMQWRTARAAASNDEMNRSSGASVPLNSESIAAVDRPGVASVGWVLSAQRGAGRYSQTAVKKVTCCGVPTSMAGAERQPFAEIYFRLDSIRSPTQTKVQLTLDQVDFGVTNCCTSNCSATNQPCNRKCKTVFIYKIMIRAHPKLGAEASCRVIMQPNHTPEIIGLQQNYNLSFQLPLVCPRQASLTYQMGSTVCRTAPTFGWAAAFGDAVSNWVCWPWELYRYTNSRKLDLNKPKWGTRPALAIRPSHMHICPGSFLADASWELQPSAELPQDLLEWELEVTLHTAILQSKSRLLGYSVTKGLTLTYEPSSQKALNRSKMNCVGGFTNG